MHPQMGYRWIILIFGMLAYTTSYFARSNYTGIAKFVSADLGLDKSMLGAMGSVFFYAYAMAQMPWGVSSDRWGSRKVVGLAIFLTAATLFGFATSTSYNQLLFWRTANGIAAAGVYVVMAGALSRWFSSRERGLAQTAFGASGAVGEGIANLIVPYLAINVASGWRQSTGIMAAAVALIGIACMVFLRSAPQGQQATERKSFDRTMLTNVQLWGFILVYSGSIIALRVFPPWLAFYAADIYIARGMSLERAVISAGILSMMYLLGRVVGVPAVGFISDRLVPRGISRNSLAIGFLILTAVLFELLPMGINSTTILGALFFLMGVSMNLYPLITTALSETFGPQKTSSVMGFLNTFAQFAGATALLLSGFLGIALNSAPGNALEEYRGIWLVGVVGCLLTASAGTAISYFVRGHYKVRTV
ncbi:MAG TPA: MFS transporter [Terriglobia bacterium]|nr:MFS transporter [Terriglobia bacterium]